MGGLTIICGVPARGKWGWQVLAQRILAGENLKQILFFAREEQRARTKFLHKKGSNKQLSAQKTLLFLMDFGLFWALTPQHTSTYFLCSGIHFAVITEVVLRMNLHLVGMKWQLQMGINPSQTQVLNTYLGLAVQAAATSGRYCPNPVS